MTGIRVHGDRFAREAGLDFAVNVRDERSPALERVLREALSGRSYPDDSAARAALAELHGRPQDEVLPLNGACEGFWLLAHALRPATAVCFHPAFTEGEAAARSSGARVTRVLARPPSFELDPQADEDAELAVVTNPNNPTGRLEPALVIASLARPGRTLLVDESFAEFAGERESLAARRDVPGLVVLRSATKLWSLAGIRAGYLLASAELVDRLEASRQPWAVSTPALAALAETARDRAWAGGVVQTVRAQRAALAAKLARLPGVRVLPSETNFFLLELERDDVPERLLAHGIAVRPAGSFPGLCDRYVRVAVRGRRENERLVEALAEVVRA